MKSEKKGKNRKKHVPLLGKQSKLVKKLHFPRTGTLFSLFWNLKKIVSGKNSEKQCEKSVSGKKNSNENKCEKMYPENIVIKHSEKNVPGKK